MDSVASLPANIRERGLERVLEEIRGVPDLSSIHELGCGGGEFTAQLLDEFGGCQLIASDIEPNVDLDGVDVLACDYSTKKGRYDLRENGAADVIVAPFLIDHYVNNFPAYPRETQLHYLTFSTGMVCQRFIGAFWEQHAIPWDVCAEIFAQRYEVVAEYRESINGEGLRVFHLKSRAMDGAQSSHPPAQP